MELEMEQKRRIIEIHNATNALNQQLLLNDDDIEGLQSQHPFYHSLKSRNK